MAVRRDEGQRVVRPPQRRGALWALLVGLACAAFAGGTALADSADDRRVRAGARLFRSLLAAEVALESKAAKDGALHLVVVGGDRRLVAEVTDLIAPGGGDNAAQIHDLPVKVSTVDGVAGLDAAQPAGVFLAAPPADAELDSLIAWGRAHNVVLYSPFEGHVERGVPAGIAVEAKVQPYLNLTALQQAGIELKPFFVKVAKVRP